MTPAERRTPRYRRLEEARMAAGSGTRVQEVNAPLSSTISPQDAQAAAMPLNAVAQWERSHSCHR